MTKSPNISVPTFPATATVLPRIRSATATFAAHPPTLVTKREVVVNSPSSGSRGIGLANTSSTRMPAHATSMLNASHYVLHGRDDPFDRRNVIVLHHRRERHRRVRSRDTSDRGVQAADASVRDAGRHLGAPSTREVVFLDDDQATGFAYGAEDRLLIERNQTSNIHDFHIDSTRL